MHRGVLSAIVSIGLLVAACAPAAAPQPTAAPPRPTAAPAPPTAAPAAKPTEAAKPAAAKPTTPAAKPAESAKPTAAAAKPAASNEEWDALVAAAKREGTLNLSTHPDLVAGMAPQFEAEFGIKIETLVGGGSEVAPKITNEFSAGQYNWDVLVHGTTTLLTSFMPQNHLQPIEPLLILPEVKDPSKWRGGAMDLLDPNKTVLSMTPFQRGTLFVNPQTLNPEEIKSYRDLLDPKFRGKMVVDDPNRSGPGQATFTFFLLHPDLGPDFIREFAKQEPILSRDYAQELDMVGQGRVLISVGTADVVAEQRKKQGVPIEIVDPRQIKEGSDVSPANGAVGIFARAPHPNAAKLFLNWLLTQRGQTAFARQTGYVSSRLDVPTDHALPWRVPAPNAIKTYDLKALSVKDELAAVLKEASLVQ
jgi:iron(III) transport system substrate-binding protein